MTKGNVIDFTLYRNQRDAIPEQPVAPVSDELKDAIQSLIKQLREPDVSIQLTPVSSRN